MKKFSSALGFALALTVVVGCSHNPGTNADPVDVTGTLSQGGRPVDGVTLNLQVTGAGLPATLPVTNGAFSGKVVPGKYTYYVSEGKNPAAFKSVPEKYHAGSLDRQIDVGSSPLTLSLD